VIKVEKCSAKIDSGSITLSVDSATALCCGIISCVCEGGNGFNL